MKKIITVLKTLCAFAWLGISLSVSIILFMNSSMWGNTIYMTFNFKMPDKYYGGGRINMESKFDKYRLYVHEPVFDDLFIKRNKGFVQVDWIGNPVLPDIIENNIDYDNDGKNDFKLTLDTRNNNVGIFKYNTNVINVMDKTSIGRLNMAGYDDSRYGVYVFGEGYQGGYPLKQFLSYNEEEFVSTDFIENIIPDQKDMTVFRDVLSSPGKYTGDFIKDVPDLKDKIIHMKDKNNNDHEIRFVTKILKNNMVEIHLKNNSNPKNEQLALIIKKNKSGSYELVKTIAYTIYKNARSVRVIIKK